MARRFMVSFLLVVAMLVSGAPMSARGDSPRMSAAGQLYFVPVGKFPPASLNHLVAYCERKFGLTIEALPPISPERQAVDYGRQQLIAEELIAQMKRAHPGLARNPRAIFIGITATDMYIRGYTWRYAFAYREDGRFAVISSARMDQANFGLSPAPALFYDRLHKMISRYIGILIYRLPVNENKNSVLYSPILGVDDLDSIGENF